MVKGLEVRGPDAGDVVFTGVCEWLVLRSGRYRSRVIPLDWLDLVDEISREKSKGAREVADALASLLDEGLLEKTDGGFRPKNLEKLSADLGAARPHRGKLSRSDGLARSGASERPPSPQGLRRSLPLGQNRNIPEAAE